MNACVASSCSIRNIVVTALTAILFFSTMMICGPAAALSGETKIIAGTSFHITYDNAHGNDVVWWDWHVVGGGGNLTFTIGMANYRDNVEVPNDSGGIIHAEDAIGSRGQFRIPPGTNGVVISWTPQGFDDVVLHYDVRLNPPDLTPYYIAVGALMAVPVAFIVIVIYREKTRVPPAR